MEEIHNAIKIIEDKRNHIKDIIKLHPYEGVQLIAIQLEFCGKLLHRLKEDVSTSWETDKPSANDCFINVITECSSMKKYNSDVLRDKLRNGMLHNEIPKSGLSISDKDPQNLDNEQIIINTNNLYDDYNCACDEIIKRCMDYENKHPCALNADKKFPKLVVKE